MIKFCSGLFTSQGVIASQGVIVIIKFFLAKRCITRRYSRVQDNKSRPRAPACPAQRGRFGARWPHRQTLKKNEFC